MATIVSSLSGDTGLQIHSALDDGLYRFAILLFMAEESNLFKFICYRLFFKLRLVSS
jgi:hypothetical protein